MTTTINILSTEYSDDVWACWLNIANDEAPPDEDVWYLPATAPGELQESELQTYFDNRAGELWTLASNKRYTPDLEERISERKLLKALVTVIVDEFNRNRDWHARPQITREDVVSALRDAIKG